jgi:hypothetical protein
LPLKALAALFLLALSGLLLMAACGGDDDEEATGTPSGTRASVGTASPAAEEPATAAPQASGGGLDPCALVTRADAEAVLGATLGEPERQTTGPFETCIYGDDAGNYVQVQVSENVYTESTFDDAMKAAAEQVDIEAEPVSGLGDKAYWLVGVLWVQKGDVTLDILVQTPELTDLRLQGDAEGEKQESLRLTTDLAEKAVDALP